MMRQAMSCQFFRAMLPVTVFVVAGLFPWPLTAAGPKMVSTPASGAMEIHGLILPDPVAAGRRDKMLREAGHKFTDNKAAVCKYPEVIVDTKLLGLVNSHSKKNGLDPRLVYALIEQESRFNPCAVSPKGAQGLMQIMPDTQKLLGLTEPFDPERNIAAGTRYLRSMLDKFQTEVMALAAYNAGPGAVAKHGGVPPYDETKDYVLKVVDRYFMLRLRYPDEGIGAIHQKLAAGDLPPAKTEKP
jgi:hypothetical protein